MIDSHFKALYLEPHLWTNLGRILSMINPDELILHVLIENGVYVKAVTSRQEEVNLQHFSKNGTLELDHIFNSYEMLAEIRIYTLKSLKQYYKKVQCHSVYSCDIDEFIAAAFQMLESEEGIEVVRRNKKKNKNCLERVKQFANSLKSGALLLWITEENSLIFNCILEFRECKLTGLYTSGKYHEYYADYEKVCSLMKQEYKNQTRYIKMEIKDLERLQY